MFSDMRKAHVLSLFDHMYWANGRLLDAAAGLPPDAFTAPSTITTRDLRATLVHELDVEWSWRLNAQGKPMEEWGPDEDLQPEDYPDVATLREHWRRDEAEMRAWLDSLSDDGLETPTSSAFTSDRRPLWQYLLHILIHAAHQQADAATLLTVAGRSPGEIGFLEYLRSRGPVDPEADLAVRSGYG
jgi:uncharacterized damage-inducible protein DinB